uniref:Plastocyanin-like domain-containing protein n=1 Tax=Pseudonaja textilis TaxID=8673 RepID=A0A670Y364_PSETE
MYAHFQSFSYKKAIFRQFMDDSYSHEVAKPLWLGLLGPELKAEEKDTFIIHFKNFASRPYSVHLHRGLSRTPVNPQKLIPGPIPSLKLSTISESKPLH